MAVLTFLIGAIKQRVLVAGIGFDFRITWTSQIGATVVCKTSL
jgi:hypothetical protein